VLQEAHKLLKENLKEFSGNIEPHEALYHKVDVIVTDGFTGNILEKSYEGAGQFIVDTLKKRNRKIIQIQNWCTIDAGRNEKIQ